MAEVQNDSSVQRGCSEYLQVICYSWGVHPNEPTRPAHENEGNKGAAAAPQHPSRPASVLEEAQSSAGSETKRDPLSARWPLMTSPVRCSHEAASIVWTWTNGLKFDIHRKSLCFVCIKTSGLKTTEQRRVDHSGFIRQQNPRSTSEVGQNLCFLAKTAD